MDPRWQSNEQDPDWGKQGGRWGSFAPGGQEWQGGAPPPRRPALTFPPGAQLGWKHSMSPSDPFLRSPSAVSSPADLKEGAQLAANDWMLVRDGAPQAQLGGAPDASFWGGFPDSGGPWPAAMPAPQLWNAVADRPEREQGRALRQQVGAMAMDAAARALTAQAHNSGMHALRGGHNLEPEAPYNLWDSRAPFLAAQKGQGFPRVQSASVLPQRGAGSWDQPDANRGFSNPDTRHQPLSADNAERSVEMSQGLRASQDFSGSLDARKGSISDSPTPEVQASGSVPISTGAQSTPNLSGQSERFKGLPPTSSGSVMRAPPAVSSDMHAPKEPVQEARNKRVRTAEDISENVPPSKRGRETPVSSQEETVPAKYSNSRVEAQQTDPQRAFSDGVKNVKTFTGSSGLADNSGEDTRVNAIMAELGNMSRDYVSVLASSGLSEIGQSSKLPEGVNNQLPVTSFPTSSMAATSAGVRPDSLPGSGPSSAPASVRQPQSYLPPSAWVRRLQPTAAAPPRPTFVPPLVPPPAVRPTMPAVRGNAPPARPVAPERGAPRPRYQGPDRNAEVPSMSFSGFSGWERAQNARSFGQAGRSFGQDHSFAGPTMRYLSGREPSADTSLASFAVPVYRGSNAGVSQSNMEGFPQVQGGPFSRAHICPFNSPSRDPPRTSPTRASDALTSPEGLADAPGQQPSFAGQQLRGFGFPEQSPRVYNFPGWPQDPRGQEHFAFPNPGLTPVQQLADAEATAVPWASNVQTERPTVFVPRPNLEPSLLPQTPAGEDVERNPVLDSSGEGAALASNPSSENQDPNLRVRIDEVPNVQTESPPEAQNSFGTKSSSLSAGVVPQQPQALVQPPEKMQTDEDTQMQQALTGAQLLAAKPSKPVIQSMPHIELPEAAQAPPERKPLPFVKGGSNREVALEQAVKNEEGSKGMGKRTASKGAWMDRLLQQAKGTAARKKDVPEELKATVQRHIPDQNLTEMEIDPPQKLKAVDPPQLSAGLSDLKRSSSNPNIQNFPATRRGGTNPLASLTLQAPWSNLDLAQALGVTSRGVELSRGNHPLKAGQSGMKVTGGVGKDGSGNRRGSQSSADFASAMANVRAWRKESARYRAGLRAESPILREAMALGETRKLTCLFCGQIGHTVAECSETPVNELSKLETLAARWNREEQTVALRCLLCHRKGHWGVECSPSLREEGNAAGQNGANVTVARSPERRKSRGHQEDAEGRLFGVNVHMERSEIGRKGKSTHNSGSGKESLSRREGNASGAGYEGSKERSKRSSHSAYRTSSGAKAGEAATGLEAMHIRKGGQKELGIVPPAELMAALEAARLPRRDLMRWSETDEFERRVEGFLVRVRFGRRAQEQNGSGYRVGRITRAASRAEQGQTVMTLTVDLGDGECIIDGQYVSNKEFTKAELEYWCQVSGGRNSTAVTLSLLQRRAAEKALWPHVG